MIPLLLSPLARKIAAVVALLAVLAGLYGWITQRAYNRGYAAAVAVQAAEVAAIQRNLDAAIAKGMAQARDLENYREAQRINSLEIENEARSDPDAVGRVPATDSLQRLKRRWGAEN